MEGRVGANKKPIKNTKTPNTKLKCKSVDLIMEDGESTHVYWECWMKVGQLSVQIAVIEEKSKW